MDNRETEDELKATKNTKNTWKWIVGIGVALMAFAFWGGYFNHDQNFSEEKQTVAPDSTNIKTDDTLINE